MDLRSRSFQTSNSNSNFQQNQSLYQGIVKQNTYNSLTEPKQRNRIVTMLKTKSQQRKFGLLVGVLLFIIVMISITNKDSREFNEVNAIANLDLEVKVSKLVAEEVTKYVSQVNEAKSSKLYPPVALLPVTDIKRIVVTGGAGFVGSHLVDKLMRQGHKVIVIDNFFTGRRENVAHWIGHKNFKLVTHDVVNPYMVEADQIYHLACPASPPHYQYNPIKTIKTSVVGTLNMLGLAKRLRARILLTSTSEVYGDPEQHPQKESYFGNVNTIGPRACYDEGKRVAETMMYSYERQEKVDVRVARIFNTFGPRMHPNDGRVVSNFIIQALQNKPITIYGSGTQTRSFQFVDDLVEGLVALMNGNYTKPVNLGNPEEYSIKEFAHLIRDLVGTDIEITYLKGTKDDPRKRKPDITLAKKVINWSPKVDVKFGLLKTIEYFREQLIQTGEFNPIKPKELRDSP